MPEYLAPGVYVEDISMGSKPIEGVSTSTAGLVGVAERGPVNVPQLVTSYGEYQRLFGGRLPIDEFSDSGRAHCYLPLAVEGFFLNGGKRAWITRVLPIDIAERAERDLFSADPALATPGDTVLLRPAQQSSGTALNRPLLYVLRPDNFAANDWVRVGDGSRAEYRQVISSGGGPMHVSLNFPLHHSHPAAAPIEAIAVTPAAAFATATFSLVASVPTGATELVVTGPDTATLIASLPPAAALGTTLLVEVGAPAAAEYTFATEALDVGGGNVRLTLAMSLRLTHDSTAGIRALDIPAGTVAQLELPANAGDLILYPDVVGADFQNVAHLVVLDSGSDSQEVHGIGQLASLPLRIPSQIACPLASMGQRVTALDDDRTIVTDANPIFTLDSVDGLAPGMALGFEVGGLPVTRIVSAIDPEAGTVTLRGTGLSGATTSTTVTVPAKNLTADVAAGSLSIPLTDRLGLAVGDVLRLGVDVIGVVRSIPGERGSPPDAGNVILEQPLGRNLNLGSVVRRQVINVDQARQPAYLVLNAQAGATELLVNDGTNFVATDVLRITLPDTTQAYHRLANAAQNQNPREIELSVALTRGHDAGQPVLEREPLLLVWTLDAGAWGNRLMVSCRNETQGLVSNAQVLAANPPPGPGLPSTLQLSSLTGVEPGTILELLDPDGSSLNLPFLKVRRVDRANRQAVLDAPGLQAAHMAAHNAALALGQTLRVRSREFSLEVLLRQRPDLAVPTRGDNLLDRELFRHLSMDPRHSRYVTRIVGATWTPGNSVDDLDIPLRHWDQRSEGASAYVRVQDLAGPAGREAIRLGPEALVDVMPSGLIRSARHALGEPPFTAGDDAVSQMVDPMYVGVDSTEPSRRTGLYSLKNLQNISLVAIPGQTTAALQQSIIDHCEEMRYRFAVLDGPGPNNDTLTDVQIQRQQYDTKYAALYHPWLTIPDPFPASPATLRQFSIPPTGHVLGLYARVDNDRGVHKAPANEVLRGITGLARFFTKAEQDILNPYPQNINVIRDFRPSSRGLRVWGARCITSDSEYKYVNVRRLLIFLEDSIDRGLQWVVFEPNDEPLWARVRRSVTNFLTTVWRNGALEGATPAQGFFVKCDRTTMTRDDIDNGRLICVIGVAPVKPAEFVIIRIGLWTSDADT